MYGCVLLCIFTNLIWVYIVSYIVERRSFGQKLFKIGNVALPSEWDWCVPADGSEECNIHFHCWSSWSNHLVLRCAISKWAGEICSNFANSYSFIIKAFNLKSELCYCCIIWSNMVSGFSLILYKSKCFFLFPFCEFYKAIFCVFEFTLQTPQLWISLVYPFGNGPCLHFVWIYFYTNWFCSWWQGMLSAVKGIDWSDVLSICW